MPKISRRAASIGRSHPAANRAFFSADLRHANAAGQAYVAERTLDALNGALSRSRPAA